MASNQRRTDDLRRLKTRAFIYQYPNGTYPAQGSVPYITDTTGTMGWSPVTVDASGNEYVPGNLVVDGSGNFGGNLDVSGDLVVDLSGHFGGNLDVSGDITGHSNLYIDLSANIGGNLDVSGDITGHSNLYIDLSGHFGGNLDVSGDITGHSNLYIDLSGHFGGNLDVSGNTTIGGNTNFNGNLDVSGDITGHSNLLIDLSGHFGGNLDVSGDITGHSNLYIDLSGHFGGNLDVSGDITGHKNLYIDLSANIGGNLDVSGNIRGRQNLRIDLSANIGGNLDVSGYLTVDSSTNPNPYKTSTLFLRSVGGNSDLKLYGDSTNPKGVIGFSAHPGGAWMSPYTTYDGAATSSIKFTPTSGINTMTFDNNGNLDVGGDISGHKNLYIDLSANIAGNLNVGGTISLAGTILYPNPVGSMMMYGGTTAPTGWLLCDGSPYSTILYPQLFAAIGATFGSNLPDMRGRFPIGAGTGTGLTTRALGSQSGLESITLTLNQMPSHTHTVTDPGHVHQFPVPGGSASAVDPGDGPRAGDPNTVDLFAYTFSATTGITIGSTGGGAPVNIMNPYLAINYIIKY